MNVASNPQLTLVGVNHTTAPVEVRERLAIPPSLLGEATRTLAHQPGIHEALILCTCNRVELLTVADDPASAALAPRSQTLSFFAEYLRVPPADIQPHLYEFRERDAIRHLFRVASSLDSMVVGEPQILGQVKESWSIARQVGAIGSTGAFSSRLDPLLQRAFSVAKRVRTETHIGSSSVSIASVAAQLARKIFGSLTGKTVLLVGAGKMSDLAARHLIQQGATTLLVSNRTQARADRIAETLRAPAGNAVPGVVVTTGVIPFDQLYDQAHRADILITSTGAAAYAGAVSPAGTGHIFTPAHARTLLHRRRNKPIFFIDIAVPRDVSPEVNDVEGCFVYDIDDLQQVAASNHATRSREAEAAESIVASEVDKFQQRLQQAPATQAIKQLLADAELIRQQEVARTLSRLSAQPLTPGQQAAIDAAIDALTRSLTSKLLHPQLAALRGTREEDPSSPDS